MAIFFSIFYETFPMFIHHIHHPRVYQAISRGETEFLASLHPSQKVAPSCLLCHWAQCTTRSHLRGKQCVETAGSMGFTVKSSQVPCVDELHELSSLSGHRKDMSDLEMLINDHIYIINTSSCYLDPLMTFEWKNGSNIGEQHALHGFPAQLPSRQNSAIRHIRVPNCGNICIFTLKMPQKYHQSENSNLYLCSLNASYIDASFNPKLLRFKCASQVNSARLQEFCPANIPVLSCFIFNLKKSGQNQVNIGKSQSYFSTKQQTWHVLSSNIPPTIRVQLQLRIDSLRNSQAIWMGLLGQA